MRDDWFSGIFRGSWWTQQERHSCLHGTGPPASSQPSLFFCPRELIVDDGPSSRVLNESWAGGGKISPGWDSVQPNSHSLVSASWDSTIKNCKKLELPTVMVYTCQKSLATHHQLLAHMTLKTWPRSQGWIGKRLMSLDLGFLLFDIIFKMIYPPNHSVHTSLHSKALTSWFFY